jgi:XTP/dITP diphosphohydrolase
LVEPLKIVLATRNRDKVQEIRDALKGLSIEILTLDNFPEVPDLVEDGTTLEQNAIKKASVVFQKTSLLSLADDTGLEVDFLNGNPGVYSSRFAGEKATYDDNINKLLKLMRGVPEEKRTARFRCVIALIGPAFSQTVEGMIEGLILEERRGTLGFGYDPVFYVPGVGKTFAEIPVSSKNQISHRGLALQKVRRLFGKMI